MWLHRESRRVCDIRHNREACQKSRWFKLLAVSTSLLNRVLYRQICEICVTGAKHMFVEQVVDAAITPAITLTITTAEERSFWQQENRSFFHWKLHLTSSWSVITSSHSISTIWFEPNNIRKVREVQITLSSNEFKPNTQSVKQSVWKVCPMNTVA